MTVPVGAFDEREVIKVIVRREASVSLPIGHAAANPRHHQTQKIS